MLRCLQRRQEKVGDTALRHLQKVELFWHLQKVELFRHLQKVELFRHLKKVGCFTPTHEQARSWCLADCGFHSHPEGRKGRMDLMRWKKESIFLTVSIYSNALFCASYQPLSPLPPSLPFPSSSLFSPSPHQHFESEVRSLKTGNKACKQCRQRAYNVRITLSTDYLPKPPCS